jgi:hypothetical protein
VLERRKAPSGQVITPAAASVVCFVVVFPPGRAANISVASAL